MTAAEQLAKRRRDLAIAAMADAARAAADEQARCQQAADLARYARLVRR